MSDLRDLVTLGPNATNSSIYIHESVKIKTFQATIMGTNCTLRIEEGCTFPSLTLHLRGDNSEVIIGKKTTCNNLFWANLSEPDTRLEFGEGCLLASVKARTSDSHQILDANTKERLNKQGNIIVGKHVWIAEDVLLLKGTIIGQDCVIGAKSLVNREIPPGSLAAGVPAKVLRSGITWR